MSVAARLSWPFALLAMIAASQAAAHEGTCKSASVPSDSVMTAERALAADTQSLAARLQLADAFMADNCFDEAVQTLEAGEALHGRSSQLQSQLREARSMQREQGYFEGLNRAEQAAKLSHNLLRCNKLADIAACDAALGSKPDDPQILISKADALVKTKRPADALAIYERARTLAPGDATLAQKIAAADSLSNELVNTCMSGAGTAALQACQSALVRGSRNEFDVLQRIGTLQQTANQPSAALDSYIAAGLLKPADRSVALSIVTLSASTGRKDALALAARGSALLTLGRALDALTPLQQALALSPDLPEAKTQLARAERLAREEAQQVIREERQKAAGAATRTGVASASASNPPQMAQAATARRFSNEAPVTQSN